MYSNNFWSTWAKFCIITHALQQFFMKLAKNNCTLPKGGENPTPTRTIFGHNGPDFFHHDLHHDGENPTPTQTIFWHTGPAFSMVPCALGRIFKKEAYASTNLHHHQENHHPHYDDICLKYPKITYKRH